MATLQVRSIDDNLYKMLGRRASMDNRSISQEVISILKAYLSTPETSDRNTTDAYLELCGSWQDDREPEAIVGELRQARRNRSSKQELF